MRSKRAPAALALLVVLAVTCAGCWDQREISDLAIIGALGLDVDLNGMPILGAEILNPAALARGVTEAGAAGESIVAWMMLEPMASYTQAFEQISRRLPRIPYLGHVNMVIFGRRAAEAGVGPWLDFLARTDIIRRSIYMSVCDTATGLLQRPYIEDIPSLTLDGLARTTGTNSMSRIVTLNEFLRRLAEPGIEPIAMHTVGRPTYDIYVAREGTRSVQAIGQDGEIKRPSGEDPRSEVDPPVDPRQNLQGSGLPQPEQTVFIGLSVFRGEQFVGAIDGLEARGFLWATGGITQTAIAVQHPGHPDGKVIMHSINSDCNYRPRLDETGLRMELRIKATFRVEETTLPLDLTDRDVIRYLEEAAAQVIMDEMQQTLDKVQLEYRSDIYGFGAEIHRRFPRHWRQIVDDWGELFPQLPVTMKAKATVRTGGLILRAAPPK